MTLHSYTLLRIKHASIIPFCLFLFLVIFIPRSLNAQAVYEPVDNNLVYELLDELAALKVITINSVVKPYSRVFIAGKLREALRNTKKLSKRQAEEIRLYLKDYQFESGLSNNLVNGLMTPDTNHLVPDHPPPVFSYDPIAVGYSGNLFRIRALPWIGGRFLLNENGNVREFNGGGEVYGYLGKHIGYYASVKYTWESEPMVNPVIFTLEEGKSWNYKGNGSVENTELRGGISVGWKWGEFGLFKDRPVWGNAKHGSNIMSGHPPSFPFIQLHLKPAKWIEFYSITGFLKSNVIDSSRSSFEQGSVSIKYHKKYFSANFITITPWKGLDFSIGNSIFWSDAFKVAYLIPFNLYKSVDETTKGSLAYADGINTNDDGHLFVDISTRNIKHIQLYLGWWIDDWVSSYLLDPKLHNAFGWKLGVNIYDLPVKNLLLTIEGSINRPRIYQEYIPAHTYANDEYNFGNYLRDDSWELYICAIYKPLRGLNISASYNIAQHGGFQYMKDDYTTYPLAKNLIFNQTVFELYSSYRLLSNVYVFIGYINTRHAGDVQFIPQVFHGNTNTLSLGILAGF